MSRKAQSRIAETVELADGRTRRTYEALEGSAIDCGGCERRLAPGERFFREAMRGQVAFCFACSRDQFWTVPDLRERGWTPALIRDFLGEEDQTRPNPAYRSGAPMRLYRRRRVEEAEVTEEFRAAAEKALRRSRRGRELFAARVFALRA